MRQGARDPAPFPGGGSAAGAGAAVAPAGSGLVIGPDSDDVPDWNDTSLRRRADRAVSTGVSEMTSSRPYLLRAVYEWIADNHLTPQIVVDAQQEHVEVPCAYVREGRIVLNISPTAVRGLRLGNERVEFNARFGGTPFDVVVPIRAVLAIMARENGTGMSFPDSGDGDRPPPAPRSRPSLRVVK